MDIEENTSILEKGSNEPVIASGEVLDKDLPLYIPDKTKEQRWAEKKENIQREIAILKGQESADLFMQFYSEHYDKFIEEMIDWRLAVSLFDDYQYCKRVGTRWIACVGPGGTGKSTIMQNACYFLDAKFKITNSNLNINDFLEKLDDDDILGNMRALFMDEPDDDIHPQTDLGKRLRKILGKARQGKFFFGVCATDLGDIPPYLWRKIDVIIFTPTLGKYMMFKNRPKLKQYPLQYIRREYSQRGYQVFFDLAKENQCLNGWTGSTVPFSKDEIKEYLKLKKNDFRSDIKEAKKLIAEKKAVADGSKLGKQAQKREDAMTRTCIKLQEQGMRQADIVHITGLSLTNVKDRLTLGKIQGY